jgi:hypothetical protein
MDETALSLEVERDFLPEWNRMLPLPEHPDCDEADRHLARGARLRIWRSRAELRPAVEAEIAEAVEHGEVAADDAEACIDRVCLILASDTAITDPPDVDEVEISLGRLRDLFAGIHGPYRPEAGAGPMPPVPHPDMYGNWPGLRWREAVEYSLKFACQNRGRGSPTTSERLARLLLRQEKLDEAAAVAAAEDQGRRDAGNAAVAALPVVFDDERQTLLRFLVRHHARGELAVPTSGNPLAEARLLAELERNWDCIGLSDADRADVIQELIRFVASRQAPTRDTLLVPGIGYAMVVEGANIVDVLPHNLTLTIEGREHVLNSPELPRPVRMPAKVYRSARLCAEAIYEQALVEVDIPRGHWRKWWPVLAARLVKLARRVEVGQRVEAWKQFVAGVTATAPDSPHSLPGGAPYRSTRDGKCYFGKQWLIEQALAAGVIGSDGEKAFSDWLGTADRNRRDAEGRQHWMIAITGNSPLCIGAACEPASKSDAACSKDANEP